jgi:hypothetical protein
LLGREGVSVRSRKSRVCRSRSETMFVSEGLVEPTFCTLRVKQLSCSEGSVPCVWVMAKGSARTCECASWGEEGVLGPRDRLQSERFLVRIP